MSEADAAGALRGALWLVLVLGGPLLVLSLAGGLVVSLLQAVTQINEPTLAFLPKVALVVGALFLLGPFMSSQVTAYTHDIVDRMVVVGGQ